jgi:hypothetical protein
MDEHGQLNPLGQVSERFRWICEAYSLMINQELTLDFHSNPGAPGFVVCQSGQSHEADSLIAVLFE